MKTCLPIFVFCLWIAGPLRADLPDIPSREEIRKKLEERSPLPAFSLEIFDAAISSQTHSVESADGEQRQSTGLIRLNRDALAGVLTTQRDSVGTTGVQSVDAAVQKLMARASMMGIQAVFYDSLRAFKDGSHPIPTFDKLKTFFGKMGDKANDDGVFYPLNRDFLIEIALIQYAVEVEVMVEGKLRENLEPGSGKHNITGFQEAISEVPVEGREVVWKVAEKPIEVRRKFFGVQEDRRNAAAVKFLPQYLDTFTHDQYAFVLALVDGKLRDMKVSVPVVNWCLDNLRNVQELLDLLNNELSDATFIRYQSEAYLRGVANPFTQPHHENYPNHPVKVAEEVFFTKVFSAILITGERQYQLSRREMILLLANRQIRAKHVNVAFRLETLLRHIELLLSEEPPETVGEWDLILRDLGRILVKDWEKEGSRLRVAKEHFIEQIWHLREEAEIRRRRWFPPTLTTFDEIVRILHENDWHDGPTPPENVLMVRAARRALTDISGQVLAVTTEQTGDPVGKFLRSGQRAKLLSQCLTGIVRASLYWPEGEEEKPMAKDESRPKE